MARKLTLKIIGEKDLGFAHATTSAVNIRDWSAVLSGDGYEEDADVIKPPVTYGAVREYAADLLTKAQERTADRTPDREAPHNLAEAFRESDGYHEWADTFSPMMNYVWPVMVRYGQDPEALAALLNEFCPVMSLVRFGEHSDHCSEEYGFALSGGGMNLADEIATAYLCAGHVPPSELLEGLAGVIDARKRQQIGGPLRLAYRKSAEYHAWRVKALRKESARIFAKPKP